MKREELGLLLLRIGLGGIFTWFGIDKFFHPKFWSAYMPGWFSGLLPTDPISFMYVMGVFEVVVGLAVLLGFFTRIAAGISAAFLFGLIASLGLNEIMIRDVGLMFLALGIAVLGAGSFSLDAKFRKL